MGGRGLRFCWLWLDLGSGDLPGHVVRARVRGRQLGTEPVLAKHRLCVFTRAHVLSGMCGAWEVRPRSAAELKEARPRSSIGLRRCAMLRRGKPSSPVWRMSAAAGRRSYTAGRLGCAALAFGVGACWLALQADGASRVVLLVFLVARSVCCV
eukprot:scaffold5850_cov61-Phaeocystis_antarctica.AAC.11